MRAKCNPWGERGNRGPARDFPVCQVASPCDRGCVIVRNCPSTCIRAPVSGKPDDEAAFLFELGRRVRQARSAAGLTRRQLAERSGLSERYLAQLEAGMHLYDAFYRWCRDAVEEVHDWPIARPALSPRPGE